MPTPKKLPPVLVRAATAQVSSLNDLPTGPPAENPNTTAILICHGMGQQVPFETLNLVVDILRQPGAPGEAPVVQHVHFVDPANPKQSRWLPRAEISVTSADGRQQRQVHVYEAYWAPLTEGHISLLAVMRFLVTAGLRGLSPQLKHFTRWIFGRIQQYERPTSTPIGLLMTLIIIASLVVINTVLTLVVGSNALGALQLGNQQKISHMLLFQLTTDLWWLVVVALIAGIPLVWSAFRREQALAARPPRPLSSGLPDYLAWGGLGLLALTIVLVAAMMAGQYLWLWHGDAAHLANVWTLYPFPTSAASRYAALAAEGVSWWVILPIWGMVLGASFWARSFFVQYLGDVVIYIDSHKLDEFHEIRGQIKRMALETACTIYGARLPSPDGLAAAPFAYDQVVLVGHSLGSVITYDALNATLNLDDTLGTKLRVAERTGSLITFGSPLDKTAFIFDSQHPDALVRVGLAASVQPMIRHLMTRSAIHWVNIYSGNDVISGALNFYELPAAVRHEAGETDDHQDVRVENLRDPQAVTPIQAHTQYWGNPLLAEQLRRAIFRRDALRS